MFLLPGIVFFAIVVADLHPEPNKDRRFDLQINLSYGKKDGEWDAQGYVYYARARGSFKLHGSLTWTEARVKCYEEGAELASPESNVLLETISSIMISASSPPLLVFTGINDLYARGIFASIRGVPLAHMPVQWKPDHQNMARHNCLALHHNGLLHGEMCAGAKRQFVCYKRLVQLDDMLCDGNEYVHYKPTHTCYKFFPARKAWSEAYATCAREDAHLLIINTDEESQVLTAVFKKSQDTTVHIGATLWKKDMYMSIDGEPVEAKRFYGAPTFQNLAVPKSHRNDRHGCLMMQKESFHKVNCSVEMPFICEKTPNKL